MITSADSPVLQAFLKGFSSTCWCGVALCIFGALVSLVRVSDGVEDAGFHRDR
jgi:hypothetical protein